MLEQAAPRTKIIVSGSHISMENYVKLIEGKPLTQVNYSARPQVGHSEIVS